jgi:hypothetical protein
VSSWAGPELLAAGDVIVPAGVNRGLRLAEIARKEKGPAWLDWATRRHPDTHVRAAALLILDSLDLPRQLDATTLDADLLAAAVARSRI